MALSTALEEAYAACDVEGDILDTLEFDHPTLATPLRFVQGTRVPGLYETVSLPVPVEGAVDFTVVAFNFTRPGLEEGGVGRAKLRVDNVSRYLQEALRAAISSDQPFSVVYRAYSTLDTGNPEVFDGLRMGNVSVSPVSATGDLFYEEIEMKAFPGLTYTLDDYPALYGQ
ncbi:MAG TPA: DUF1833 family protein [Bosea sp. (in: a-proteobacteria)]|jgi:hypothetical protein|uniref:DUF1833 family protein n=1 Tax=Bosea sp. (in: a-proteobacteria) TaxID=1871050 RepID=UPI002DDC9DCA|nr:DUF1833 family protein [Bosea sp. (in: a-proteobacteria)]HEV2552709.1 DUF1833 family protein [Bosea sp. (in: a-proteobacteria)]